MPTSSRSRRTPRSVLTIAGADSGGGAGIAADLRVFDHFGLHGLATITAVTAQNTREVRSIHVVPAAEVAAQIATVRADFAIAAIKTGMLATASNLRAVVAAVDTGVRVPLVVDPVLRAGTGRTLLSARALSTLRRRLFPLATVVTPNLPELAALCGHPVDDERALAAAARMLGEDGAAAVLVKGGHGAGSRLIDRLFIGGHEVQRWSHRRRPLTTHGTGCTLASAIAARLALGDPLDAACDAAIDFLQGLLAAPTMPSRSGTALLVPRRP